jgi:PKD repeat protein
LSVAFTDLSTGSPTAWQWDFENDGIVDSTLQNPTWIYATPGTYSVKLTAFNQYGADAEVKIAYVNVTTPPPPTPPVADFVGLPLTGAAPLLVQFTDLSTNTPTSWQWDFENDGIVDSIAQNPQWTYTNSGTYSVKLTVFNDDGSDFLVKTAYVTVTGAPAECPLPSSVEDPDTIDLWHFDEGIGATEINPTIYFGGFPPTVTLGGSFFLGPSETNCGTAIYTGDQFGSSEIQLLDGPSLIIPG